jgi:hypothetical protein
MWLKWKRLILSTGTFSILLNGTLGKQFECKRVVHQGVPFRLCSIYLALIYCNRQSMSCYIFGRLCNSIEMNDMDFPIIQYVDYTLLILPEDGSQLMALKEVLNRFSRSTVLRINF